jgi:hypothetical protein
LTFLLSFNTNETQRDSGAVGGQQGPVRTHVSSILSKLQLASRTQAALYPLKEGIAKLEDA